MSTTTINTVQELRAYLKGLPGNCLLMCASRGNVRKCRMTKTSLLMVNNGDKKLKSLLLIKMDKEKDK